VVSDIAIDEANEVTCEYYGVLKATGKKCACSKCGGNKNKRKR
jgi:hypothetical protein